MKFQNSVVVILMVLIGSALVPSAFAQEQSESEGSSAFTALLSWLPLIFLVGFWFVFAKHMKAQKELQRRTLEYMDKVENLLERVAVAVEEPHK